MLTLGLITTLGMAHPEPAVPTRVQREWHDLEVGVFIHFAPNTWQDKEGDDLSTPLEQINPERLDTEQWAQAAVNMGARYVVFVAKHAGGFCMWQTDTTDYGIRNTPWKGGKGDVVADIARSCRKHGLRLGFYLSPRDDHLGAGLGGICADPAKQQAYTEIYRRQLTELLTRYGDIFEVWFDGNLKLPVDDILKQHAARCIFFQGPMASIRWVGNEDGVAPYPTWNAVPGEKARSGESLGSDGDPGGDTWLPAEVDVSIRRPFWFWSTTNEKNLLTLDQLLEIYYKSVGRGANLLLNMTPNRDGLIPTHDFQRIQEFGDEVRRRFHRSEGETTGEGSVVELRLPRPAQVDHVIVQERLEFGERVRQYSLEGLTDEGWMELGRGSAIGHQRIQPVGPARLSAVRLTIQQAAGRPMIRRLAVYATKAVPPAGWDR